MHEKQKTLKQKVTLKGTGLHTGQNVELTINPAEADKGYVFKRTDLEHQPHIKAQVDQVITTERGTTIQIEDNIYISTIEHLLASLYGLGIDNAVIEVNGGEMPILDGSARPYVESIFKAGIAELNNDKEYFTLEEKVVYKDEKSGIELIGIPDEDFSVNVQIDYDSRVLGNQYASLENMKGFKDEIAPCRTFVFFHELEYLYKHNLIKGGDLDNAIVIVENHIDQKEIDRMADLFNKPSVEAKPEGILNNVDLYFSNEPARHKLLDFIGDIALLGKPLKGRFYITKPGHKVNNDFARQIYSQIKKRKYKQLPPRYSPNTKPVYDINQIKQILPHRPPFLLIDKILEISDDRIVGLKNVTMNEGFFMGHFPEEPVMPGVLQVESMAQVGGILALNSVPDPENYLTYFLKIENMKFKRKVSPGDTIIFELDMKEPIRRGLVTMFGRGFVGENIVLEGTMMAQIVKAGKN